MLTSQKIKSVENGGYDGVFAKLYPASDINRVRERYLRILREFLRLYGEKEVTLFSVPGRTELSGNHTDHNNGTALAGSVDIDIIAAVAASGDMTVRMKSEGYREDVVDISCTDPDKCIKGKSSAIIAGVADYLKKHGYIARGYCACTASDVISGSGLSSSAAFEVMCGRIFSELYNGGKVPVMELAKAGKYAENVFFGKPCGLLDQAACASGGCLWIDFKDDSAPVTEKIDFDLSKDGYCLCIVNTGGNHADLTDDYAAVPAEMKSVAKLLGKDVLRNCDESAFYAALPELRKKVSDRALLRAIHFFNENRRVSAQRDALKRGDIKEYLSLVKQSGDSSFKFLQNVFTTRNVAEQGVSLALALSESFGAVCRVHGGGFAGTIQAYLPVGRANDYKKFIEKTFGEGSCRITGIRPYGAAVLDENGIRG
ncbi:MAG: galactokinase [Clostridia bacterium]|nr:galactokinase [Clostridia bacterium]